MVCHGGGSLEPQEGFRLGCRVNVWRIWRGCTVRHPQKVIETGENYRVSRGVSLKLFEQLEGKGDRGKSK